MARSPKPLTFAYAVRSFRGYLEGTGKAAHTIKSYLLDLSTFRRFLVRGLRQSEPSLGRLQLADINEFQKFLKRSGLKTNSRRRKILTVRRFLRYLQKRNKIKIDVSEKIPAPYRLERTPGVVAMSDLLGRIRELEDSNEMTARNKALLWTLAETGCLVSEIATLRHQSWFKEKGGYFLRIEGKRERSVPVSAKLYSYIRDTKTKSKREHLFFGFNKFGPLNMPISPRGVELLVKVYAKRLGLTTLTPRMIRHSTVLEWMTKGISQREIQDRLGLKSDYAFRSYDLLLKRTKSKLKTTSKPETNPTGF